MRAFPGEGGWLPRRPSAPCPGKRRHPRPRGGAGKPFRRACGSTGQESRRAGRFPTVSPTSGEPVGLRLRHEAKGFSIPHREKAIRLHGGKERGRAFGGREAVLQARQEWENGTFGSAWGIGKKAGRRSRVSCCHSAQAQSKKRFGRGRRAPASPRDEEDRGGLEGREKRERCSLFGTFPPLPAGLLSPHPLDVTFLTKR